MSKSALLSILAAVAGLASCVPPPVPPPRFKPNPPYPPEPVPYNNPPPVTDDSNYNPPPPPESQPVGPGQYPTARRTDKPNEVISPYEPYNVIDISGPPPFKSGQLARDPSNQKIFRVP